MLESVIEDHHWSFVQTSYQIITKPLILSQLKRFILEINQLECSPQSIVLTLYKRGCFEGWRKGSDQLATDSVNSLRVQIEYNTQLS